LANHSEITGYLKLKGDVNMARKNRIKMWCQECGKNTVHEARMVEDKETFVCLKCAAPPEQFSEEHPKQNLTDEFKYPLSGTVQPKRVSETVIDRMRPLF
jgi:hypothetical protein